MTSSYTPIPEILEPEIIEPLCKSVTGYVSIPLEKQASKTGVLEPDMAQVPYYLSFNQSSILDLYTKKVNDK